MDIAQAPLRLGVEHASLIGPIGDGDPRASLDARAMSRRDADDAAAELSVQEDFAAQRLGQLHLAGQPATGELEMLRSHANDDRLPLGDACVAWQRKRDAVLGDKRAAAAIAPRLAA